MDKSLHVTGILIYRHQRNSTEVLLVNDSFNHKRHWTAPKGRVIGDEDELKYVLMPFSSSFFDGWRLTPLCTRSMEHAGELPSR